MEMDSTENEVMGLNRMAMKALKENEIDRSFYLLTQAKKIQTPKLEGITFNNLGCYYKRIGDLERALKFFTKATKYQSEILPGTFLNICTLYSQKGDHSTALEYAFKALEAPSDQHETIALAYKNIGIEYELLESEEKSIIYYKKGWDYSLKYLKNSPITDSLKQNFMNAIIQSKKELPLTRGFSQKRNRINKQFLNTRFLTGDRQKPMYIRVSPQIKPISKQRKIQKITSLIRKLNGNPKQIRVRSSSKPKLKRTLPAEKSEPPKKEWKAVKTIQRPVCLSVEPAEEHDEEEFIPIPVKNKVGVVSGARKYSLVANKKQHDVLVEMQTWARKSYSSEVYNVKEKSAVTIQK